MSEPLSKAQQRLAEMIAEQGIVPQPPPDLPPQIQMVPKGTPLHPNSIYRYGRQYAADPIWCRYNLQHPKVRALFLQYYQDHPQTTSIYLFEQWLDELVEKGQLRDDKKA
jgi:hypothetical protein